MGRLSAGLRPAEQWRHFLRGFRMNRRGQIQVHYKHQISRFGFNTRDNGITDREQLRKNNAS
jgi:hypothetical protein